MSRRSDECLGSLSAPKAGENAWRGAVLVRVTCLQSWAARGPGQAWELDFEIL